MHQFPRAEFSRSPGLIPNRNLQLCIRHNLTMLTADEDFTHVAKHATLKLWMG